MNLTNNSKYAKIELSIRMISPKDFEHFAALFLVQNGHTNVQTIGKTGDHGADIISMDDNRKKCVTQVKYWDGTISESVVRDLEGSKKYYDAEHALLITSAELTEPAKKVAAALGVEFYERMEPSRSTQMKFSADDIEDISIKWLESREYSEIDIISIEPVEGSVTRSRVHFVCKQKTGWLKKEPRTGVLTVDANTGVIGYKFEARVENPLKTKTTRRKV